jgi:hypothetical protein
MTEDPLTSALTALRRVPVPVRWDDVERRLAEQPTSSSGFDGGRGPRRRGSRLIVAVIVAAVLVAGVVLAWPNGRVDPVRTGSESTSEPSTASTPRADGATESSTTTAPATRTLRTSPVIVVIGSEYLVWAGEPG